MKAKARWCRRCRADLAAKPQAGTRRNRLPPLVTVTLHRVKPNGAQVTIQVHYCPGCIPGSLAVLEDSVLS